MGHVIDVLDGVQGAIQNYAQSINADSTALGNINALKIGALNSINIAIQDGAVNKTDAAISFGIGVLGAGLASVFGFAALPVVLIGIGASTTYNAFASDGTKQALRELGELADTMTSNRELNFPAWMNGLMDMFDDSVETPDPILTLRNIGMRGGDPLILDLNGDGVELVQLADSTARFDVNGDDFATPTGWVNANDGLLVLDKNSNGRIDSVNERFGNTTVTGFEELALCSDYLDIQLSKAA